MNSLNVRAAIYTALLLVGAVLTSYLCIKFPIFLACFGIVVGSLAAGVLVWVLFTLVRELARKRDE